MSKKLLSATIALSLAATAAAADIRLVVPYSAGGPTDFVARLIAPTISETLGETVIVENRPGASGMIGMTSVAQAEPDGQTLVVGTQGQVLTELIQADVVTYDLRKDFTFVALAGELPSVLVVNNDLPVNSLKDLIQLSKDRSLHYASSGVGNSPHLAGEMINKQLGIKMGHVPYAGAAPAVVDVIAGNVDMFAADIAAVVETVKAGSVKAVAMLAPERSAALPDVESAAEQGYPELGTGGYYFIAGPAGMAEDVRARLETAIIQALETEDLTEKFTNNGLGRPGTGADVVRILDEEYAKWIPFIDDFGIENFKQ